MSDKQELARDVRNLLEYAETLGMTEVPISEARGTKDEGRRTNSTKPTDTLKRNAMTSEQKQAALDALCTEIGDCKRCKLCDGRNKLVFGVGNPDAEILFVGEAPGRDEDKQGIPFVGRAGKLLTDIIQAMTYTRDEVYIGNICKCRPPSNRNPEPDEVKSCIPFLIGQAEIIEPKVIVCLGSVATQNLLQTEEKISKLRGRFTEWQGIPVMPTYHPAFLLRNGTMKKPVWEDMQQVMKLLGRKPA